MIFSLLFKCVSIDDLKKSILDDGNDLDDETIDILTRLIQIQSVNNGCDFCKRGAKEKVKRLDGISILFFF